MSRFTAACLLASLLGCSGTAPNAVPAKDDLWMVYEGNDPQHIVSNGKPVVSGNSVSFVEWPTGKSITISGKFKFQEAEVMTCTQCKKTVLKETIQCGFCSKILDEKTWERIKKAEIQQQKLNDMYR